jgi:hypothetical protein
LYITQVCAKLVPPIASHAAFVLTPLLHLSILSLACRNPLLIETSGERSLL